MTSSKEKKGDNHASAISNLRNDINMLDITPSITPNTSNLNLNIGNNTNTSDDSYHPQWICSECSFQNHSLLTQCEICDAHLTKDCKWKGELASVDEIIINIITPSSDRERKRIRSYHQKVSQSKRRKISNDESKKDREYVTKDKYDQNIDVETMETEIAQKYKQRELRLIQIHQIQTKRLQRQIQDLQIENARLLNQNEKYKTTQQGIKWMLHDNERTESIHYSLELSDDDMNEGILSEGISDGKRSNPFDDAIDIRPPTLSETNNNHNNHNNGVDGYQCRFCSKQFETKSARNHHERIHNTATQYECVLCKVEFTQKEYYFQHLKTKKHKKKEEEGRRSSSICGYRKEQKNEANDEVDF